MIDLHSSKSNGYFVSLFMTVASDPDNIHPKVLTELHSELAPAVTAIFQQTSSKVQTSSSGRQLLSPQSSRRVSTILLLTTDMCHLCHPLHTPGAHHYNSNDESRRVQPYPPSMLAWLQSYEVLCFKSPQVQRNI